MVVPEPMGKASLLAAVILVSLACVCSAVAWAQPKAVSGAVDIAGVDQGARVVSVSSEARDRNNQVIPQWTSRNLIDGKFVVGNFVPPDSYGWSSDKPPTPEKPEWFVIAFKGDQTRLINRIVIDPTTDDPPYIGRWVRDIELQVSTTTADGPFKSIGRFVVVAKPIKQTFEFPPVEARYIRILIYANHGSDKCVELGEFEVYEAIISGDVLDQLIIRLENLLQDLKRYRDGVLYQQGRDLTEDVTRKAPPPPATPPGPAAPAGGGETPPPAPK
jgi:hypothetical protein